MKGLLKKNPRLRLALAALAVALIATVVSGREKPGTQLVAPAAERAAAQISAQNAAPAVDDIDLEKLRRPKKDGAAAAAADLFGADDSQPPVNAASGHKKAVPAEPPLPFKYLGKVIDDGKLSVFLENGGAHYSVQQGQTVDNQYRIDKVTEAAVTFTYLPTGTRKVLAIPAPTEAASSPAPEGPAAPESRKP